MKFTEEDREIVARVKRNVPFILAVVASAPLFFLALISAISGSYISFVFFSLAQVFFVLAFHREHKWPKLKSAAVVIFCLVLGVLFFYQQPNSPISLHLP